MTIHLFAGVVFTFLTAVNGDQFAIAGGPSRSPAVRAEFRAQNPCPSTGKTRGACLGWEIDHRTPLCIGGKDSVENLQWLTVEAHRQKTRSDVRLCRNRTP